MMMRRSKAGTDPQYQKREDTVGAMGSKVQILETNLLQPHPRQAELVGDMRAVEFDLLVDDIEERGIQNALILMANGRTIICGHQRHRAALRLRFKTVPCLIRSDLNDPADPEVLKLLLTDNLRRRQLGPLEKARYVMHLFELELGRRIERGSDWDQTNQVAVREAVGKQLGCSGRNAARYLAVLETPPSVQEAFAEGLLSLALTSSVAFLRPQAKEKLGESIAKLLAHATSKHAKKTKHRIKHLVEMELRKSRQPKPARGPSPMDPLRTIIDCLEETLPVIDETFDAVVRKLQGDDLDPGLGAEGIELLTSIRRPVVLELRQQADRLIALVARIELAVAAPEATAEKCT